MAWPWYLTRSAYNALVARVARLESTVQSLQKQEKQMAVDLSALTAEVTNNTQVEGSVVALVNSLAAQVAALKTGNTDAQTQAAIDALVAQLQTNDTAIAQAVVANTHAPQPAPPTPPPAG